MTQKRFMWGPHPSVRQYPSRIAVTERCRAFLKFGMGKQVWIW